MAESIPLDRFLRLLADESVPVVHRALWALLWESDVRVLDLLALEVADESRIRPQAGGALGGQAETLLARLVAGRTSGPLFAVGGRTLSWDEAVRTAGAAGVPIHAFRTSGRQHRGAL
ncbi:hypothetical protein [Streptomyces marincola]|nr:hypothetical protein [Streptomyces marincola]